MSAATYVDDPAYLDPDVVLEALRRPGAYRHPALAEAMERALGAD